MYNNVFKFISHQIIPAKYRWLIFLTFSLSILSGIFDALSISLFYDITTVVQAKLDHNILVSNLLSFGALTVTAYLSKILLLWLTIWLSYRLSGILNLALLQKSLNINGRSDHLSDTLNDVTRVTELVSMNYILGSLKLISGIIISLIIISSLLKTSNGYASALIFLLISFYITLSIMMKKLFTSASTIINDKTKETVSLAKSILASRETISALSMEEIKTVGIKAITTEDCVNQEPILSKQSRLFIEFFGLILIIAFILSQPDQLGIILSEIALLAITAQRLLPILQQIYASQSSMRISKKMFEDLFRKMPLTLTKKKNINRKKVETLELSIDWKSGNSKTILSKGDILKINGSSGSGKTTLLRSIIGISNHFRVTLQLNDKKVDNLIGHVAYSSQSADLFSGTLRENVCMFKNLSDEKYNKLEEICKLRHISDRLQNDTIDPDGTQLSGGERQRIFLARNLAIDVDIVILDEAFAGLNEDLAESIIHDMLLEFPNKIFIVVEHTRIFDQLITEKLNVSPS